MSQQRLSFPPPEKQSKNRAELACSLQAGKNKLRTDQALVYRKEIIPNSQYNVPNQLLYCLINCVYLKGEVSLKSRGSRSPDRVRHGVNYSLFAFPFLFFLPFSTPTLWFSCLFSAPLVTAPPFATDLPFWIDFTFWTDFPF